MDELYRLLPAATFGEVRSATPIQVGLSGAAVYSASTELGEFVLRLFRGAREQWQHSVAMQRRFAAHGLSPAIVSVDEAAMAVVSNKVAASSLGAALSDSTQRAAFFADLTTRLAAMHEISMLGLPAPRDPIAHTRQLWSELPSRAGFPAWAAGFAARLDDIESVVAADSRVSVIHGDANPSNLLWDGSRIWFVDFDLAGLGHPFLDLAVVANFLSLPNDAAEHLLRGQERRALAAADRAVFAALRDLARLAYGVMFLKLVPDLTAVTFHDRAATPTYRECAIAMSLGSLSPRQPQGQAMLGAALLAQVGTGS